MQAGVVAVLVTTLSFFLIQLAPGRPFDPLLENPNVDPAIIARLNAQFGFDDPVPTQFARYVANVASGNLGWSFARSQPVAAAIRATLPNTLLLMATAIGLSVLLGVLLGVAQAVRRGSRFDRLSRAASLGFFSLPDFWLAAVLLIVFAKWLPLFPPGGIADPLAEYMPFWPRLLDRLHHLVLPVATLVLLTTAGTARLQRAAMLDTLPEDYVRTAAAKGVSARGVVLRHALRNALLPIVTTLGLMLPALLVCAVFVERVFAWPGMGELLLGAVLTRDYFLLTGCVLVGALLVVAGSLLADLLTLAADPRQRRA